MDYTSFFSQPINSLSILVVVSLIPILFVATTSYLKISIVLSILRNALGGGQIPSQALTGVIALVLSVYTMLPVFNHCYREGALMYTKTAEVNKKELSFYMSLGIKSAQPFVAFLKRNTRSSETHFVRSLEEKRRVATQVCATEKCEESPSNVLSKGISHILGFILSELRIAFEVGVWIYVPFLVVDLVVSTVLTGLGMMMLSPMTISLPLKLILFSLSDGWALLFSSLIHSYQM